MKLDDSQRQRVSAWINEGLKLSEIQSRLASEFGLKLTYMEARFLVEFHAADQPEAVHLINEAGIVAHADLVGRAITLESTQEVLYDLLRANDRRVSIDEIQKKVAEHYTIKLADMHSARRSRTVARPRQVAMYLCKQLTTRSLPEIGRKFGGRDHTTVIHAVKKVEELRSIDSSFDEDIELLRRMLEG